MGVFVILFASGLADYLIKGRLIKGNTGAGKRWVTWGDVPRFFRDYVPGRPIWHMRYAYAVNIIFAVLCEAVYWIYFELPGYGGPAYIILLWSNWEHIFYQWSKGFLSDKWRLFDLPDLPLWLEELPWNRWFARYHGKSEVTSEEIMTIALLGAGVFLLFGKGYHYLKGLI